MGTYRQPGGESTIDKRFGTAVAGFGAISQTGFAMSAAAKLKKEKEEAEEEARKDRIMAAKNALNKEHYSMKDALQAIPDIPKNTLDDNARKQLNAELLRVQEICNQTIDKQGKYKDNANCLKARSKLKKASTELATLVGSLHGDATTWAEKRGNDMNAVDGAVPGAKYNDHKGLLNTFHDRNGEDLTISIEDDGSVILKHTNRKKEEKQWRNLYLHPTRTFTQEELENAEIENYATNPNFEEVMVEVDDEDYSISSTVYQAMSDAGEDGIKYISKEHTEDLLDATFASFKNKTSYESIKNQIKTNRTTKTIDNYTQANKDMHNLIDNQRSLQINEEMYYYLGVNEDLDADGDPLGDWDPDNQIQKTKGKEAIARYMKKQLKEDEELISTLTDKSIDTTPPDTKTTITTDDKKALAVKAKNIASSYESNPANGAIQAAAYLNKATGKQNYLTTDEYVDMLVEEAILAELGPDATSAQIQGIKLNDAYRKNIMSINRISDDSAVYDYSGNKIDLSAKNILTIKLKNYSVSEKEAEQLTQP